MPCEKLLTGKRPESMQAGRLHHWAYRVPRALPNRAAIERAEDPQAVDQVGYPAAEHD